MLANPLRRARSSGPQVNGVHRRTEDSIWLDLRGEVVDDTTSPQLQSRVMSTKAAVVWCHSR
jgi:hypothetical protein